MPMRMLNAESRLVGWLCILDTPPLYPRYDNIGVLQGPRFIKHSIRRCCAAWAR